jgi:Zn-dependent M28 family amino/carboxypeptidase
LASSVVAVLVAGLIVLAGPPEVPESALIDSARLLSDLKTLSDDSMQGRRTGTAGAEKARAFIAERFKSSGAIPFGPSYESPFTFSTRRGSGEERGVNVIGFIEGRRRADRYIVVSAHYDHLGARNGVIFNGADDNASGTAALFAIAQYFTAHPPTNSLIFAAFDAEELGLQGSQAFLKKPPVDIHHISLNLNLDMIGRDPDRKLFVVGTALQPFLRPYIDAVARKSSVQLLVGHENPAQPEDWTRDSDHFSFLQARIPALYFGVEDFDQHHKASDDYETMTYEFYVRAVETIVRVTEQFDANLDDVDKARGTGR